MEQYMWIIWLSLFVVMVIVEASGPALLSIWFAFGSLVSLIVSLIPGVPWWVELIIFIVISITTLFALRPIFRKYLKRNVVRTNIDSFIGKKGYVIEDISYLRPGAIKIGDVSWTAIPVNEKETIKENEVVEVVSLSGNKIIVKKVEE